MHKKTCKGAFFTFQNRVVNLSTWLLFKKKNIPLGICRKPCAKGKWRSVSLSKKRQQMKFENFVRIEFDWK